MDKYIKAYDVIEWFRPYWHTSESISFEELAECIRYIIEPADVAPVVHGEWIDIPDGTETICSYCKAGWNVFDNDTYMFNYCPNCGAKMDLE